MPTFPAKEYTTPVEEVLALPHPDAVLLKICS